MGDSRPDKAVFVYGTLREGFPNHEYLPSGTVKLGPVVTQDRFPLVLGPYGIPFMLDRPNVDGAFKLTGELVFVTSPGLRYLDTFEGVQNSFYSRKKISVVTDSKEVFEAWTFVRHKRNGGPSWVKSWTVERLAQQQMHPEFTLKLAEGFVPRLARSEVNEIPSEANELVANDQVANDQVANETPATVIAGDCDEVDDSLSSESQLRYGSTDSLL